MDIIGCQSGEAELTGAWTLGEHYVHVHEDTRVQVSIEPASHKHVLFHDGRQVGQHLRVNQECDAL